ncbi:CPBP family intramembrane glutamic endopeptidase [Caproiciproducens sp. MSJ-32]|uniref:CPBP family intramembrane glutamic endopeptidase n=1 Tax=Caproiciproducens sp. MSJ-32 TaxID=2841527 RepID=UPI002570A664|nr:type II CAAX endopeptidase family protein [Caproiciproducens sp. MSJ-32]
MIMKGSEKMKEKFKSFLAAIGYLVLVLAIQFVVSAVAGIVVGFIYAFTSISGGNEVDFIQIQNFIGSSMNIIFTITNVIITATFLIIYKVRKKSFKEELQFRKTKNINIITAVILGLSIWLFDSGVLSIIQEAGLLAEHFATMEETLSPITQGNMFIVIISVGIIGPFVEELIFRGLIYKTLIKKFSVLWTIIIQAILFGLFHFNLIQSAYATLMGILLGYAVYKTKSIWPAVLMHIVNNLASSIIPELVPEAIITRGVHIAFIILGTIGVFASIYLIKSKNISVEEKLKIEI